MSSYRYSYQKCGFCNETGHNITKCQDSRINEADEKMLIASAVSSLFPFVNDIFIKSELEKIK